ncbi:MAG TPA: glycosyltransferase family 2 protein [Prolixibacteraceae bacterium]|nr:glycosyltransferase family 2 protein [Prolixibacteraceae bacterium]
MNTLAVIVVNWNGLSDTVECMNSILTQSHTGFTVFLADNASSNSEFEELNLLFGSNPRVVLIRNAKNLGFGIAHNNLFEKQIEEGYKWVALLNNDAVADREWLNQALLAMEEHKADAVACRMLQYHSPSLLDSAGLYMLNTGELLPRGHMQPAEKWTNTEPVIAFSGGACLLKLDLIKEIGGFDPYFHTGYEDAELGLRAFLSGKKIIYEPRSVVYHKMGQSLAKDWNYRRTRKIILDSRYTWFKLMPWTVTALYAPLILLRSLLILLVHLLAFRFRYIAVFFDAGYRFLRYDRARIARARKTFFRRIGIRKILSMQVSFLKTDTQRFYRFFVKVKPTKFERN